MQLPLGFKGSIQHFGTCDIGLLSIYVGDFLGFPWCHTFNILKHIKEIERKREAVIF
jgi:hypothetical protein